MWAIPLASRSTEAGPSSPGTSTGSAAAPGRARRPAAAGRARTTMMARRIGVSPGTAPRPGATAAGVVRTRRSLPKRYVRSSPGRTGPRPGRGPGQTRSDDSFATSRGPRPVLPLVVAAVAAVALVAGGCTSGDRPAAGRGGQGADEGQAAAPVRVTVTPRTGRPGSGSTPGPEVVADAGRLRAVRVTGPGGSWPGPGRRRPHLGQHRPLAPATRYRVVAEAVDDAGTPTRTRPASPPCGPGPSCGRRSCPWTARRSGSACPSASGSASRWPTGPRSSGASR